MSVWQLIVGIGLSVMVLISMFLPRIQLSNYKVIDITEDLAKSILQKMDKATDWLSDYIEDYDMDDAIDEIEDQMDDARDEVDNRETSMSSAKMIFAKDRQYAKLISGLRSGSQEDRLYAKIKDSFNGIGDKMLGIRILIVVIMFLQIDVLVVYLLTFIRKNKNYLAAVTTLISSGIIIITNVLWYIAAPIIACNKLMDEVKKVDIWDTGIIEEVIDDKKSAFYPTYLKVWFRLTGLGGHLLLVCGFLMFVFVFLLLLFGKRKERVGNRMGYVGLNNQWNAQKNVGVNNQWSVQENDGGNNQWNGGSNNQWKQQSAAPEINQWKMNGDMIPPQGNGGLEALHGCMAGAKLDCAPGEQIVVGRDPAVSELVLMNAKVSRRHFVMQYEAQKGGYQIFCYSKNGLSLSDGRTIGEKQTAFVKKGTVISLADGAEQLRLR